MKKIKKDELYKNLGGFLAEKGVEFKDGPYTSRIRQGCSLLTDCINYTQSGIGKAKSKIDEKLGRMRQIIHEKTAPPSVKTPPANPKPPRKPAKPAAKTAAKTVSKSAAKTAVKTAAKPAPKTATSPAQAKPAEPETPKEVKPE